MPVAPAVCNREHTTDGCPGTEKIASGFPTSNPSPHTEHPPCAGATGAAITGEFGVELAAEKGDVVPVEIGDVELVFGAHPHVSRIKLGSNAHLSAGRTPVAPAFSNVEHDTVGCPGNSKMASGFPTANPSPHMEHPPSSGARTGAALEGASGAMLTTEEGGAVTV
jgi:hypothetical protein